MLTVVAASVFCAPGVALHRDPGQASLLKQHKGTVPLLFFIVCTVVLFVFFV